VSYWQDEESIRHWKAFTEHLEAQRKGRTEWYSEYSVRVAKVERAYQFSQK
jgi:heme-degrading monooxygenase HmoA